MQRVRTRTTVLMGLLLALVLGYVVQAYSQQQGAQIPPWAIATPSPTPGPPLPGKNSVTGLTVSQTPDGRWMAAYDYFFTGAPANGQLRVVLVADPLDVSGLTSGYLQAVRGAHHVSTEILRPGVTANSIDSTEVVVEMRFGNEVIATQRLAQTIHWPDSEKWQEDREVASLTPEANLKAIVAFIDRGDSISMRLAKNRLENLVAKDPKFADAYVELARVAMKTNWGPEGLHQAESLLLSALQIQPDNVNAKVLLGYIYAHQGRYKPAEALFVEASKTDTHNLWLWANWGELLAMQSKTDLAIQKYREAIVRPRPHDTYDRARLDAYAHLLDILEKRNDLDGMEALHKQRVEEFGPTTCFGADYARFVLQQRGDAAASIVLAKASIDASCRSTAARDVLGLAYYMTWAGSAEPARLQALNQARVFLPAGPRPLYLLATSERTLPAAKQLVAAGEAIDQRDNDKLDALAYALQRKDHAAARRLVKLGARPDAPIGLVDMPVALIPVIQNDLDGIRLMQQLGVDYNTLRFQGQTAIDHARSLGDRRLLEALRPKANSL